MIQQIYFNKNLKYLTENTIISQAVLSKMLGIPRQAVHNLISSDSDVRLSTASKIAEVYDIKTSDLIFTDLEDKYKDKKLVYKKEIRRIN